MTVTAVGSPLRSVALLVMGGWLVKLPGPGIISWHYVEWALNPISEVLAAPKVAVLLWHL